MGCWESFCCFCSGPFENPRREWIRHLEGSMPEDWPPGSKLHKLNEDEDIPTEILDEFVTISERDGAVWDRCVCVTSEAPESFVSPPCSVDSYGCVYVEGWDRRLHTDEFLLLIHPVCLAFVCRHNSITPRELWESFYAGSSGYQAHRDDLRNGLLHCIDYHEMKGRAGQAFEYDFETTGDEDDSSSERLKALQWLLARPTFLPTPQKLQLTLGEGRSMQARSKAFKIPEILDNIIDYVVDVPVHVIESELKESHEAFEAQSAITAAKTLLSLAQVDRSFYQAVMGNRQDVFLTATRSFGWMLPFTPADWSDSGWPDNVLNDAVLVRGSDIDWRAYLLKCMRKETPNIRNRWRLHKMAVQFARGRNGHRFEKNSTCIWNAGSLGFKSDLQKPDAKGWEVNMSW